MDYKKELVEYAKLCEIKGLVNALEGNVSILDREKNLLYITPTGTRKATLEEEDVAVLEFDSEKQLSGKKASSEYRLHKAAYLARKDCNAVIHSHCEALTSFAIRGEDVVCDAMALFRIVKGRAKCLPYGQPGTVEIAKGIEEAISDSPICLLGNHGVICIAPTLDKCEAWLEGLEGATKTMLLAKQSGELKPIPGFWEQF